MKILEKELEEFLFDNLNKNRYEYLRSIGFRMNNLDAFNFYRQTYLGSYGISDILGLKIHSHKNQYGQNYAEYMIIELKEGPITEKSVIQLLRYNGAIESALNMYDRSPCDLVLIGSSVSKELERELLLTSPYITCITYKLSLEGISFNCNSVHEYEEIKDIDIDVPDSGEKINKIITDLLHISENERDITDKK